MVPMDSFYTIICYPITFILSILNQSITLCLGSRVDMVSKLNPVSLIFAPSLQ